MINGTTYSRVCEAYQREDIESRLLNLALGTQHLGMQMKIDALNNDIKSCYLAPIKPVSDHQRLLEPTVMEFRAYCLTTRLNALCLYAKDAEMNHSQISKFEVRELCKVAKIIREAKQSAQDDSSAEATSKHFPLRFGQLRAAPYFQSLSCGKETLEIQVAGRTVKAVAADLMSDTFSMSYEAKGVGACQRLSAVLPIEVFPYSSENGIEPNLAIAINNRCLAAHALAETRPLRLLPRLPTEKEMQRLSESEPTAMSFDRSTMHVERVQLDNNHQVPSSKIPLTIQSKGNVEIELVAEIPEHWSIKI